METWGRGAIRGGCLFAAAYVATLLPGGRWEFDASTTGLWLLLGALLPAGWARLDTSSHGSVATEWIWVHAAVWTAAGALIATLLHGWSLFLCGLVAWGAAACVAVPAWSSISWVTRTDSAPPTGARQPVPTGIMTLLTVGGVALFVVPAVVVFGFEASILWDGCFLECTRPNHVGAVGFAAAGAALLADVIVWGMAAWRRFPRRLTGAAAIPLFGYAVAAFLII